HLADAAAQLAVNRDGHERAGLARRRTLKQRRHGTRARQMPGERVAGYLQQLPPFGFGQHRLSGFSLKKAAAAYPTTDDLSPEPPPESGYRNPWPRVAPSSRAARITATAGPPPHA